MNKIITFLLVCLFTTTTFASGGLFRRSNNISYQPNYYYYYPRIVEEKYIIPIREVKLNEVKGLRVLESVDGKKYYEINGKLYPESQDGVILNSEIKHKIENNKIIIERVLKY